MIALLYRRTVTIALVDYTMNNPHLNEKSFFAYENLSLDFFSYTFIIVLVVTIGMEIIAIKQYDVF